VERLGKNLLEAVALDRIVRNFRGRDRLPRKEPAAVHDCEVPFSPISAIARAAYGTVLPVNETAIAALAAVDLPAASAVLLTLDPSDPYSAFVLHSSSIGGCMRSARNRWALRASGAAERAGKSAN
jgi:hypothetical protein